MTPFSVKIPQFRSFTAVSKFDGFADGIIFGLLDHLSAERAICALMVNDMG
jgi:hypothetical protein